MLRNRSVPALLPHQEEGVAFLRGKAAAALFDEQGLGKSKQLIEAVSRDIEANVVDAALILCPNTLKSTWATEIEQHSSHRYAVFGSGKSARRDAFRSLRAQFYVLNYEAVAAEMASLKALLRFKRIALVLDESHRIKTPQAKVTRAALSLREHAVKRYIMTGTPVANKPEDLWSQLFFLDDGESLGRTFQEFTSTYGPAAGRYQRIDELRHRLLTISLRREKAGTIPLPAKRVVRVSATLLGRQREMYNQLRNELELWVRNMSGREVLTQAENILTRLVRLAQIASNPSLIDVGYNEVPAKFSALDELLASYIGTCNQKVLVWTSFVGNIEQLIARYEGYSPVSLYGEMDAVARDHAIDAFKRNREVKLLIANPAAAREGLTLTEAAVAIYVDRTFNLVDFLQSQDRIHRLSQTRDCEIVLLIAEDTIDEFVDFALSQKHRLARYTQGDADTIAAADLALRKPDLLRSLVNPAAPE